MSERIDALSDTAAASLDTLRAQPIAPGAQIGRYVVISQLGSGGMGVVYRGRDPELGREVAVKVLHPHLADQRARLLREGQAIARLSHANVVTIHDVGTHGDGLFIAMELVDGTTLRAWLASDPPPSVGAIVETFVRAGEGLAAAHAAAIVHRDFKPDNVLVGRDGRVVVTDFGLARAVGTESAPGLAGPVELTQSGTFTGTPLYMSPEQFTGGEVGVASDQFSFCVALYEALYRTRPFGGQTVAAIMEAVTEQAPKPQPVSAAIGARLRDAIFVGLARDPAARHGSMRALLAALVPPRPQRSRRARVAIVVAAIAIGATALAVTRSRDDNPTAAIDPCLAATVRIDPLWTPAIRARAVATLAAVDAAAGDVAQIDAFVARWKALRAAACRTTHAEPVASCLDHQLADLEGVPKAWLDDVTASHWITLPSPDRCEHAPEVTVTGLHDTLVSTDTFSIEPGGARYAIDHDDRVRITEVASGTRRTYPIPDDRVMQEWTDARHLAWRSQHTGAIALLDTETGTWSAERLPPTGLEILAAGTGWTEVAALAGDGALVAAPFATGAPTVLAKPDELGQVLSSMWSPDGARLATVQAPRGSHELGAVELVIYERPAAGTTAHVARQRLRGDPNADDSYELAWRDPQHLIVAAGTSRTEGTHLWIVGGERLEDFVRPPALALRVRPDTSFVQLSATRGHLFAVESTQTKMISRVSPDGRATPLPRTDNLHITDVTRDGKSLLVARDGEAQLLATADGTTTALGTGVAFVVAGRIATFTTCANGARCIVEHDPPTASPHVVDATAGDPRTIACSAGTCLEIAAAEQSATVRAIRIDGALGPPIVLAPIERAGEVDIRPSPDGKRVAVMRPFAAARGLYVHSLDHPAQQPVRWLAADAHCYPIRASWLDDATLEVAELCSGTGRIVEVQRDRPARVVFETPNAIEDLVVTADRTLYVAERVYANSVVQLDGL